MDEMKIESKLLRGIISKIISSVIRKKLGYKVDITINDAITATVKDGRAHVHLNIDADMSTNEFKKIQNVIEKES